MYGFDSMLYLCEHKMLNVGDSSHETTRDESSVTTTQRKRKKIYSFYLPSYT